MNKLAPILAGFALAGSLTAAPAEAAAAPCWQLSVGNSIHSHITTWYSIDPFTGEPRYNDSAVPGEWVVGHVRYVRVESGYDIRAGREGQGYTLRFNSTGWHRFGSCSGGDWVTKQIPNGTN